MNQEEVLQDIKRDLEDIKSTLDYLASYTLARIPSRERERIREKHLWEERHRKGEAEREITHYKKRSLVVYHGTAPDIKCMRSEVYEIPPKKTMAEEAIDVEAVESCEAGICPRCGGNLEVIGVVRVDDLSFWISFEMKSSPINSFLLHLPLSFLLI